MDYAEEQRHRWNGAAAHAWAASQAVLDRLFEPLADRLADRLADLAAARRPDQLLNVDCGIAAVRPAFDRYVHGDEIRFTAACWMVSARRRQRALGQSPTFRFAWIARSSDGYREAVSSGLCSKLCSDRDGSRRIRRHRTELRSWDSFRKLRVLASFVTA